MSNRNFKNWIDSFLEYSKNDYVPQIFDLWTGLSTLSGALERKVWLHEGHETHYPNTFVLLVGGPGTGKSSSIRKGVRLLERLKKDVRPDMKIISGLLSQAGLCQEMKGEIQTFSHANQIHPYWSVFYYNGEGSDSGLQNLAGDFNATITALYDCEDTYRKKLKYEEYEVANPSLGLLVGTTYDFLKNLLGQTSIGGGLASRLIFAITDKENIAPDIEYKLGLLEKSEETPERQRFADALYQDLTQINRLTGKFRAHPDAVKLYGEWHGRYCEEFNALGSERMRAMLIRKPTNLKKLLMLYSVAERDDLGITEEHVTRAILTIEAVTKDNSKVVSSAVTGDKNSQEGINQMIMQTIKKRGGDLLFRTLKAEYSRYGGDVSRFDGTVKHLVESGLVHTYMAPGNNYRAKLLVDPDTQL